MYRECLINVMTDFRRASYAFSGRSIHPSTAVLLNKGKLTLGGEEQSLDKTSSSLCECTPVLTGDRWPYSPFSLPYPHSA